MPVGLIRPGVLPRLFHPTAIPDCQACFEWDYDVTAALGMVVDGTAEPWVFTTTPNLGSLGGTVGSAGAVRFAVGHIEAGGITRRCASGDNVSFYAASSLAAANWAFLHGTSTMLIVARAPHTVAVETSDYVSTYDLVAAKLGVDVLARHGGNQDLLWRVGNGAARRVDASSGAGNWAEGEANLAVLRLDAGAYDMRVNGVSVASGVPLAAGVGAPAATLELGRRAIVNLYYLIGQHCLFAAWDRYLDASEVAALEAYGSLKYQNNSERLKKSPTFWFNPSVANGYRIDGGNVAAGEQVDRLKDVGGNAHDAYETTDAKQLTLDRSDADFGSSASLEGDGAADAMSVGAGVGWPAGTDHSLIAAIDQDDAAGVSDYLLDAQTGCLIFAPLANTAGKVGIYDGTWRDVADAAAGPQILEWHLDDAGNTVEIFRDGEFLASGVYGASRALGGLVGLCGRNDAAAEYFDGKVAELWHRDSLLTGEDLFDVRSEMWAEHGFPWTPLVHPDHVSWINPDEYREMWIEGAEFLQEFLFSGWSQVRASTADDTTDLYDPNGLQRASKVTEDGTATNTHHVYSTPRALLDAFAWIEVDFHAGLSGSARGITIGSASLASYARFYGGAVVATAGSAKGTDNATVTSLGGGWYRCRARILPEFGDNRIRLYLNDGSSETYSGDGASHVYLHHAWVEQAEGQLLDPTDQTTANWILSFVTPSTGESDPNGGMAANLITDSNDVGVPTTHRFRQAPTGDQTAPARVVFYVKAGTLSWIRWTVGAVWEYINVSTGVAGTNSGGDTADIEDAGTGWYRISVAFPHTSGQSLSVYTASGDGGISYAGDGTGTIYVYALVFEQRRVLAEFDLSRQLAGVGTDLDGETAGTAAWTPNLGTTILSKVATARTGGLGTQVLKILNNAGGPSNCYARQNPYAAGVRYRFTGWTKVPSGRPRVFAGLISPLIWSGELSLATWQRYRAVGTTDTTDFTIGIGSANHTEYSQWDDMTITPSNDTFQGTAGSQPIYWPATDTEPAHVQFDGVDDYEVWVAPNAVTGTMYCWAKETAGALGATVIGCAIGGGNASFIGIRAAAYEWEYALGTTSHNSGIAVVQNAWTLLVLTWDGTDAILTVDGVTVSNANIGVAGTPPVVVGARGSAGAPTFFFEGLIGQHGILDRALTADEIADIYANTKAEYGL